MNLSDVVTLFCTETFSDAFNPATTFKGRVNPFSEVTNSGESSRRRILETPVGESVPSSRVVTSPSGEIFIVADSNSDYWEGSELRRKYPLLPVTELAAVGSIGEFLAGTGYDSQVYAYPYFVRREADEEELSDYFSGFEIYFSRVKNFDRSAVVRLGSVYYRLKTDTWVGGAGFSIAQAIKLENPIQVFDVVTKAGAYNSLTDSYTPTTVPNITCFVEPLKEDYEFISPSFSKIEVGDKAISLLKSAVNVSIGDMVGDFRIVSIRDLGALDICQCRYLS